MQRWNVCAELAKRFRDGRVFLAGDSAHDMPPTGGFGGNVGVQDGHNLAWKLAYVLNGAAGPELLHTYEAERQPLGGPAPSRPTPATRYGSPPSSARRTCSRRPGVRRGVGPPSLRRGRPGGRHGRRRGLENPHQPSAGPGTRLPHAVIDRDGEPVSMHHLLRRASCSSQAPRPRRVRRRCSASESLASTWTLTGSVAAASRRSDGRFAEVYGMGAEGAVLVRPDGFVAWRARNAQGDAHDVLGNVLGRVLARS